MKRAPLIVAAGLLAIVASSRPVSAAELQDLYFGEALYYAHQGYFFEALERLDAEMRQHAELDEPELDTLYEHLDDAEFSLGDFELRYRMHHRAGRAIKAVLEGSIDEQVRNDAAYRLARIHFQKNQLDDAEIALQRIEGRVPVAIRDDIEFLRANVLLGQQRPAEAVEVLTQLGNSNEFGAFAAYNLGIAYLQDGQLSAAEEQLDRAGRVESSDPADLAIRDKSNLVLGTMLMESGEPERAVPYLNRVRLDGPFSNKALLSAGWASLSSDDAERALVPWSLLADREVTDRATQEAMLALPYAYGSLEVHGRAATLYGQALDLYGGEIDKLNLSIESIREGKFLEALIREEIRKNEDWVIRLRTLPDTPETYYLMELMAAHEFQTGLQNYLDLADLRRKLITWRHSFDAFEDVVADRSTHYEPLLPEVDTNFRELDSRMRLRIEQHKILTRRRDDLLTTPRPEFLATPEEQQVLGQLEELQAQLDATGSKDENLARRLKRLRGTVSWTLQTEYHARLTEFDHNLRSLDGAIALMQQEYDQYVRARQAATHSFVGYDRPINSLRSQVSQALVEVDLLMARQGRDLEIVAIDELIARRGRLETYRDKARFALADSYDRATKQQAMRLEQ